MPKANLQPHYHAYPLRWALADRRYVPDTSTPRSFRHDTLDAAVKDSWDREVAEPRRSPYSQPDRIWRTTECTESCLRQNEFRCSICRGVFEKAWTDDEAASEAVQRWGGAALAQGASVVCEDCFQNLVKEG